MSAPHTILLLTRSYLEREGKLNDDTKPITPGMLLTAIAGGDKPTLEPGPAATVAPPVMMVATELPQRFGQDIDTPYTVEGEVVEYYIPITGEHLYMFLEPAGNVAAGAILESGGLGYLQAGTTSPLCRALEAVDNSAGGTAVRIRVEVL